MLLACGDGATTETTTATEGTEPAATGRQSTTTASTTTTEPTTTTTAPPPTVVVAGDSVIYDVSPALEAALDPRAADVVPLVVPSLGAESSRSVLVQQVDASKPDVVVVSVGVWERRFEMGGGLLAGDPGFAEIYTAEVLDPLRQRIEVGGGRLVIVGPPLVREAATNEEFAQLEAIWSGFADAHASVTFVDADSWITVDGAFTEYSQEPRTRLRRVDGVHLCAEGARRVASGLIEEIETVLGGVELVTAPGWETGPWTGRFPPDECPPLG